MKLIQFVFGLHNHQPVGNFDTVFEDAFNTAYDPFLGLLEKHPGIRVALHHTGPLLQWLEQHRSEYLDRLGMLVERDQVELLGGAFYEPILPIIPEDDRIGQIVKMSDWLEARFGRRPRGMWLAERVWEPTLPRAIKAAGIEFTVLDDSHFKSVGIGDEGTTGYYLTEDQGDSIAIFPINESLRYSIPFQEIGETLEYLRGLASEYAAPTVVMADDGEKFGVWPNTYKHCYEDEWLDKFFCKIEENSDWIKMKTFSEVLDETAPIGRVYLPTASYIEMMEWAMPASAIVEYRDLVQTMKMRGEYESRKIFIRGGFWRSFFSKYDESNHIHKKMLRISNKLNAAPEELWDHPEYELALDHLWQAQCNCAYWHGVFGGLYLSNIRNALYKHLIEAEKRIDALTHDGDAWVDFVATDFDIDGSVDLLVETPAQMMMLKPGSGGMMVEHDLRQISFNALDTLMRRPEYYHQRLSQISNPAGPNAGDQGPLRVKESGLERFLVFDWYRRGSLIDHFLDPDATPENFRTAHYPEIGDFVNKPYACEWKKVRGGARVRMVREANVQPSDTGQPVEVEKIVTMKAGEPTASIAYRVTNLSDEDLLTRFGVEFNVNLLAGHAHDRLHEIAGSDIPDTDRRMDSVGAVQQVSKFAVCDEWLGVRIGWNVSKPASHWRLPIETVSSSEAGFERVYQSTVVMPVWDINLAPKKTFEVKIEYGAEYL
ncbi:DUF1926 domain-containing protein [bacterium]|nr:DUF1926 domain-containing protein [bacterium]